jgi:hypothetical protein
VLPVKDRNTVLVVSNYAAGILNNYYHEALPATSAENMFYEQIKHDISTSIKQKKAFYEQHDCHSNKTSIETWLAPCQQNLNQPEILTNSVI